MHREPKKPKNPLFPDNDKDNAPKTFDISNVEMSAEERINTYWSNNKSSIIGAIIISAIVIISVQGFKIAEQKAESERETAYEVAKLENSLENFIETYAETVLGGFAALELANDAYEDSDYTKALQYYTTAENALSKHPLKDKASIGIAFTRYQMDSFEGLSALESLFADSNKLESVRAEAGYILLVDAKSKGDEAKVKAFAKTINAFENAGNWKFRINQFL